MLDTLIEEGVLYFAPEPKSPHGVDVAPNGEFIVVSGKLDPHVTVYSITRIKQAIADKNWEPDAYGVPVLNQDAVVEAQVEVGLGPLHTQFDNKGYAYTVPLPGHGSRALDARRRVRRLNPGPGVDAGDEDPACTTTSATSSRRGGHGQSPDGNYLVSLNKWSVDRFFPPGPAVAAELPAHRHSAEPGDKMQLLYDMPIGLGEPHYAQICKADKLDPWKVYPEVGWDPHTQQVDASAAKAGGEGVVRNGNKVDIYMTAIRSHFTPEHVNVNEGDQVTWHITNVERAEDATHGFALPAYNVNLSLEPGEALSFDFVANQPGVFSYYCSEFCSALHLEMVGYLLVKPKSL